MPIITDIKRLRTKSEPFTGTLSELTDLFCKLNEELGSSEITGVGLAAIQIDIPLRVCIIRSKTLTLNLWNAEIVEKKNPHIFESEGCLSIPNIFKDTMRFKDIVVRNGDGTEYELSGFDAVVVQHELGHFDGELFLDYVLNTSEGGI